MTQCFCVFVLVHSLKCYECETKINSKPNDFCLDPFRGVSGKVPASAYQECVRSNFTSFRTPSRPVCMKIKFFYESSNKSTIHRKCHWEGEEISKNDCSKTTVDPEVRIDFCETCSRDGCNGGGRVGSLRIFYFLQVLLVRFLCGKF